jgi:hypothetical protein
MKKKTKNVVAKNVVAKNVVRAIKAATGNFEKRLSLEEATSLINTLGDLMGTKTYKDNSMVTTTTSGISETAIFSLPKTSTNEGSPGLKRFIYLAKKYNKISFKGDENTLVLQASD